MKRSWIRNTLTAAALVAATAGSASAQAFNFNTTGQFTSGVPQCTTGNALTVTCSDPSSTLQLSFTGRNWTSVEPFGFLSGSTVTLGNFNTSGNGAATVGTGAVSFTLYINQTMPTTGTNSTVGFITGTINRPVAGANFSDLIWSPTKIVVINPVTYDLIFRDNKPGIPLAASGNTTIEAVAIVSPEPSTYVLMVAGLAGVFAMSRKRRTA